MHKRRIAEAFILLSLLGACQTWADHPSDWAYDGSEWARPHPAGPSELRDPGLIMLDPWLKETPEGQAIVTLGFRDAARGHVSEEIAHRANIWFRRYADHDRDMRLTDPEIRTALVQAAGRYRR